MNAPRKPRKEDNSDLFFRAMLSGSSNAILSQEADGQKSFVNSDTLPTEMHRDAKKVLEIAGVKFMGIVKDDPVFQYVELPARWKKVGTDHSMWSNLIDEKGRKRASIFYKAASYDRSANISVCRRYSLRIDYDKLEKNTAIAMVMDGEKEVIFTTDPLEFTGNETRFEVQDKVIKMAENWLKEHFPEWENASAYWD